MAAGKRGKRNTTDGRICPRTSYTDRLGRQRAVVFSPPGIRTRFQRSIASFASCSVLVDEATPAEQALVSIGKRLVDETRSADGATKATAAMPGLSLKRSSLISDANGLLAFDAPLSVLVFEARRAHGEPILDDIPIIGEILLAVPTKKGIRQMRTHQINELNLVRTCAKSRRYWLVVSTGGESMGLSVTPSEAAKDQA